MTIIYKSTIAALSLGVGHSYLTNKIKEEKIQSLKEENAAWIARNEKVEKFIEENLPPKAIIDEMSYLIGFQMTPKLISRRDSGLTQPDLGWPAESRFSTLFGYLEKRIEENEEFREQIKLNPELNHLLKKEVVKP